MDKLQIQMDRLCSKESMYAMLHFVFFRMFAVAAVVHYTVWSFVIETSNKDIVGSPETVFTVDIHGETMFQKVMLDVLYYSDRAVHLSLLAMAVLCLFYLIFWLTNRPSTLP